MNSITDSPTGPSRNEAEITLGLLTAIEADSRVTQRSVAKDLGIALGLANAYLKRCVKKGLVKVSEAPANRYAYYLTPHGFSEKSRLTAEYLSSSFNFFRKARNQCEEALRLCAANGHKQLVFVGSGDLAEVALLCAGQLDVVVVEVAETSNPPASDVADAAVITDYSAAQATYETLLENWADERLYAPRFLNLTRKQDAEAAGVLS